MTSPRSLMSSGKPGAAQTGRHRRIGFMPPNNCDPAATPIEAAPIDDAELEEGACPKCGAVMEPIESAVEGLPLEHLQLCPDCYLVMWRNEDGFQIRQGVPMKGDADVPGNAGAAPKRGDRIA